MAQKGKPIADQRLVLALSRRKEPKPATPVRSLLSPSTHGIGAFAPGETALPNDNTSVHHDPAGRCFGRWDLSLERFDTT